MISMTNQVMIVSRLHSGGNGDLFIGWRSDTGEFVVVKYLREFAAPYARRAFAREVRVLGRKLQGLIPLLFANTAAERPYYVMPYLKGGALMRYAGRLTDDQLLTIARELARTLANIHATYEVHGDVKPDNVLVTQDGRLQVADPLGNGTVFTMLLSENHGGTPGYWAPEIGAGGSISRAGDVYSYGATLYELLTGQKPRDGQRLDPSSGGHLGAPKIPQIIAACCQADPHRRPSMQEVLRMLRGEEWADIEATRKQRQQLLGACVIAGLVVLYRYMRGSSIGITA
jgi:eukaryotic-like serine/threonine-protein kinase